jgi:carboxymethylenebutenolidase
MAVVQPVHEHYDDVTGREVELDVTGGTTSVLVYEPTAGTPRPAIVIGAEGGGINQFIREVAATLAHIGYMALVPDYYRGVKMADPDDYSDIPSMMRMIDALDFRRAAHDFLDTIRFARQLPTVNGKVAAWGYCTGGTVAMFGACLDRELSAAMLFYPSQPRFDRIDATRPVHVIDLVWNIRCPVMFAYGDLDQIMAPDALAALDRQLGQWGIEHEIKIYPGAGHAFSSPGFAMYNPEASRAAWEDGVAWATRHLG